MKCGLLVCSFFAFAAAGGAAAAETINVSSAAELTNAVRRVAEIRKANRDVPIEIVFSGGL